MLRLSALIGCKAPFDPATALIEAPTRYLRGASCSGLVTRVVLNAINIVGAMSFVSTPNADLARDGLAGAGQG